MIKTFINGKSESVNINTRELEFNNGGVSYDGVSYVLASTTPITPPDSRTWELVAQPMVDASSLPDDFAIIIAPTREGCIYGGETAKYPYLKSSYNGDSIEMARIPVNEPFYIGVGNTNVGMTESEFQTYIDYLNYYFDINLFITEQGDNNVISFKGDTEPCAVYVDGERQDNISYIPQEVTGESSVDYKSEYKKNLRTLQIDGNTVQEEYKTDNLFDINATPLLGTVFPTVEGDYKPKIENGVIYSGGTSAYEGCYMFVPTNDIDKFSISFDVDYATVESGMGWRIGLCDTIGEEISDVYAGGFAFTMPQEINQKGKVTYDFDLDGVEKSYIGICWYSSTQYNLAITNLEIIGTPTLSIKYHWELKNSGNSRVDITVRGKNLFDINNLQLTGTDPNQLLAHIQPVVENGIMYFNGAYGATDGAYSYIETDGADYLTFSAKTTFKEPQTNTYLRIRAFNEFDENGLIIDNKPFTTINWAELETLTQAVNVSGYKYIAFACWSNNRGVAGLYDIQIEKGETATDYEPYIEPTTVGIPQYTTLEPGANDVVLELARLGDYADKLVIDRTKGTVKYIQQICVIRPFVSVGGTFSYMGQTTTHDVWRFIPNKNALYSTEAQGLVKCEFAKTIVGIVEITGLDADAFGVMLSANNNINVYFPIALGITTAEALDSYLMQNGGYFGLKIQYVLEAPVEWDLLNSDIEDVRNLGQALFEWAKATQNQTNIIEITSTPSVSKLSVNYAKWGGTP